MSIRQRLYPSEADTAIVVRHCSDARFVYNLGLEQRNLWRPERTQPVTYLTQARELAEARQEFPWLKEGSNRRNRTKHQLAKLSAREADRRRDWIEKTTTTLLRDYDVIAIEDLRVKNMVRSASGTKENPGKHVAQKRGLNREILNQSWSLFRQRLEDKSLSATSPVEIIPVNPRFTSQTCPQCKNTAGENRKSQAVFSCIICGHSANADINAAQNILAAGRRGTPQAKPAMTDHSGPVKRQPLEGSAA